MAKASTVKVSREVRETATKQFGAVAEKTGFEAVVIARVEAGNTAGLRPDQVRAIKAAVAAARVTNGSRPTPAQR